ncbi:helix-turn-helix domain-containing protein, partial [Streptomyces nojiriensis]|uniref:helix-turn-helix domain-containing protein n=1 Tax=Streptomyces nojiriensis TaxID=66374 RepID=UPI00365A2BE1
MPEDTAGPEFAGLLRQLKERSGLSYGTLAGRLHMSTSTLHRYCSGEVVPADYAPVERLARLCKATPEELLALHRGWVEADTNRPRRGADTSGTTATDTAPAVADEAPAVKAEVAEVPPAAGTAGPPAPARRPRPRRAVLAAVAVPVVAAVTALTWVLTLDGSRPGRDAEVRDSPVAADRTSGAQTSPQGPDGSSVPTSTSTSTSPEPSPAPAVAAPAPPPAPRAPPPGGRGARR